MRWLEGRTTYSFRILTILLLTVLGTSYDSASSQTVESNAKVQGGSLAENIYTSTYFGFTYTFPKGWNVLLGPKETDCEARCALLDVRAPDYPDGGKIGIWVDELQRTPARTSGRDYLSLLHSDTERVGGKALTDVIETTRQGRTFYRRDYRMKGLAGHGWFESNVVLTLKKSAVWFSISAVSHQKLMELLLTLDSIRFS
jgi:hypothetical protein